MERDNGYDDGEGWRPMSDRDFTWHLPGPPPVSIEELAR